MLAQLLAATTFLGALHENYLTMFPLIALAFMISAGISALLYMASSALQSQDLLGMAKNNLADLIMSGIIVLLFFALFGIISQIACILAIGGGGFQCEDHVTAAYQSILFLRSKLISIYSQLYVYEILFGFLSTLGFSIPVPALSPATLLTMLITIPSLSFSPLSGLAPISNAHTVIVELVGTALIMVLARQVILEFILRYLFIFFALGAGLRAFSLTRKTGSSILALCAVAYFVYPLAVIFTNYLIFQAYHPTNFGVVPTAAGYCEDPETMKNLAEDFKDERETLYHPGLTKNTSFWYRFWQFLLDAINFLGKSIMMVLKVLFSFNALQLFFLVLSPVAFSTFYDFLLIEIQSMTQFLVVVFVAFFVEIVLTITMYRSLASFMEGETEIFGISKLM